MVVYENGHGSHTRALVIEAVVPISHGRHSSPAFGLNEPTSHAMHVPLSASVPGLHFSHCVRSSFETEPSIQAVHEEAPPVDAVPALHEAQVVAASPE